MMTALFLFTFLFGVVAMLMTTKLFIGTFSEPLEWLFAYDERSNRFLTTRIKNVMTWLDRMLIMFSMMYQTYWWFTFFGVDISM